MYSFNPDINSDKNSAYFKKRRIFVDSRDRNPAKYANANNFTVSLSEPAKGVKSLTLTDFKVPIVAGYPYAILVVKNLQDLTQIPINEGIKFPSGTLAVVPLIPVHTTATYAYYQPIDRNNAGGGWKIEFPMALPKLNHLEFEILTWGGSATATGWGSTYSANSAVLSAVPIRYPLTDENILTPPADDNNVFIGLELTHQL